MATYIVFLRAINVGGRYVKMQALREHLESAGFQKVETHIQSGNVRLASSARSTAKVAESVETALVAALGFEVKAIVRTPRELVRTVATSPPSPFSDEARHFVVLLRDSPTSEAASRLDAWDVDGEHLQLAGRDLHLWLTKPFNEAKSTNARLEVLAGVAATTRDWKVIRALADKWR